MDFFSTSSLFTFGIIIAIGIALAPIIQVAWTLRILIASYISLCLVMLMPDNLIFGIHANLIYFFSIVILFSLIERSRFFDVANWSVGRFSFEIIGLSVLTTFFITSIICFLTSYTYLQILIPNPEICTFFNDYIFYIAIAPLIFSVLFSKRLSY
ncbi:MAG: hypothetical protein ACKUBY_04700 [Candidatus Moraniibacteriota bacterium]|jgi:hypothetical protein